MEGLLIGLLLAGLLDGVDLLTVTLGLLDAGLDGSKGEPVACLQLTLVFAHLSWPF